jgi:large subunit ribosomal protein L1
MAKTTKRAVEISKMIDKSASYNLSDAVELLQKLPKTSFTQSVEVSFNLGLDVRKSDQTIRGAVVLPNGTGKTLKVAVFAQGDAAKAATDAGADRVGFEDLADAVKAGELDFDVVIASPDAMPIVGKLGQILGPKGLMPNPKVGTVTKNVAEAVQNAKAGQVQFRTDKAGIVHAMIGKLDFTVDALVGNFKELLSAIKKAKPSGAKGVFLKKVTLSSTMGPGLTIDIADLD